MMQSFCQRSARAAAGLVRSGWRKSVSSHAGTGRSRGWQFRQNRSNFTYAPFFALKLAFGIPILLSTGLLSPVESGSSDQDQDGSNSAVDAHLLKWLEMLSDYKNSVARLALLRLISSQIHPDFDERSAALLFRHGVVQVLARLHQDAADADSNALRVAAARLAAQLSRFACSVDHFTSSEFLGIVDEWCQDRDVVVVRFASEIVRNAVVRGDSSEEFRQKSIGMVLGLSRSSVGDDEDVLANVTSTLLAFASQGRTKEIVRSGFLPVIRASARRHPSDSVQLQVAKLLNVVVNADAREVSVDDWNDFLQFWSRSADKQLRLTTVNILGELVKDDAVALKIMSSHGLQLFLDASQGLPSSDIQDAITRSLDHIKKSKAFVLDVSASNILAAQDVVLDDEFNIASAPSLSYLSRRPKHNVEYA